MSPQQTRIITWSAVVTGLICCSIIAFAVKSQPEKPPPPKPQVKAPKQRLKRPKRQPKPKPISKPKPFEPEPYIAKSLQGDDAETTLNTILEYSKQGLTAEQIVRRMYPNSKGKQFEHDAKMVGGLIELHDALEEGLDAKQAAHEAEFTFTIFAGHREAAGDHDNFIKLCGDAYLRSKWPSIAIMYSGGLFDDYEAVKARYSAGKSWSGQYWARIRLPESHDVFLDILVIEVGVSQSVFRITGISLPTMTGKGNP